VEVVNGGMNIVENIKAELKLDLVRSHVLLSQSLKTTAVPTISRRRCFANQEMSQLQ